MKPLEIRDLARIGLLAAIYLVVGKLGLMLDAVSGFATLVWPPTGLSLVAVLLFGFQLWPAVLIGAFAVDGLSGGALGAAAGVASREHARQSRAGPDAAHRLERARSLDVD